LRYAVRKFPRGLLTGSCPLSWTLPSHQTPSTKSNHPHTANSISHEIPIGQSIASVTRPPPGPMVTYNTREQFTSNDIEELNTQLEKNLLPTDSGTRLSRAQTQASKQSARSSNASQRTNISNISDKPWKP
jgi:hypothetical protein